MARRLRRALPALAALAAALAVPASAAGGLIVIGKGIRGAAVDMTQKQVRGVLGTPTKTIRGTNDFGPYTQLRYGGLSVMFQGNAKVTSVRTTSPADRTASGIGVGSTKASLKARVKGVRCEVVLGDEFCYVGRYEPGRLATAFLLDKRGRIRDVTIGYVID